MGNAGFNVHMGSDVGNPTVSDSAVIASQVICCIGTLSASLYYATRAYRSKAGPTLGHGKYMKDYSGHFEVRC
jgi:hypothetical protein